MDKTWITAFVQVDRLCGLVVRVLGYRSVPGFDSWHYKKKKVVGLERGPLSLVSTIEKLLERKSSVFGLEIREYDRRNPSLYSQKLALTSPKNGVL
jgi:hypothetical protein